MNHRLVTTSTLTLAAFLCLAGSAGADAAAGKTDFETNCASCHGMSGKGDGPVSAALSPKPRDFSVGEFTLDANKSGSPGEDEDLQLVIKNGALMYGGSPLMAAWPTLNDDQVGNLIAYIRSLKE